MATTSTTIDIEGQKDDNYERELSRIKSAGAITISPELFERVTRSVIVN
jgi:hypothetical protein